MSQSVGLQRIKKIGLKLPTLYKSKFPNFASFINNKK